jgi:hypothetical protein
MRAGAVEADESSEFRGGLDRSAMSDYYPSIPAMCIEAMVRGLR